jgi:cysteinyl-tRNA synthetase
MVKSAEERGKSVLEVADFYTKAFFDDTEQMNILLPTVICKATDHIDDMIALIRRIEEGGFTYMSGGNLYFDIAKFPHYGDLARLRLDDLRAGARTGLDENKRNPQDFVLWFTKSKFENQALVWDSPWGRGYPGWHIECSTMSIKYLGETFDLHAGGIDHIAVHHTNEIAQSEAATGKHPWVRYWLHNEFVVLDKDKMSKSTGKFLTLESLWTAGFEPLDYRYLLLGAHYRTQLLFSYTALEGARKARSSLRDRIRVLADKAGLYEVPEELPLTQGKAAAYLDAFNTAMDSDLSTPRALAELWGLLRDSAVDPRDAVLAALDMDRILGLNLASEFPEEEEEDPVDPLEIEALIAERAMAKKAKDFAKADKIRESLRERGIILADGPEETTWRSCIKRGNNVERSPSHE